MKKSFVLWFVFSFGVLVCAALFWGVSARNRFREGIARQPLNETHVKIGVLLGSGGRDDRSFNASAFQGATKAQKELAFPVKIAEPLYDAEIEVNLRTFSELGFTDIITVGLASGAALDRVAPSYPDVHFGIIDATITHPNVSSILFRDQEGSFLVGAIAGMMSQSHRVGFIGGMDIPLIRRFGFGYRGGATYVYPETEVFFNYVGTSGTAWRDPTTAKEIAIRQFQKGADIVFVAAGGSNGGVFEAAAEQNFYAIGCDSNQNWMQPGKILTSMLKRVDVATYEFIRQAKEKKFRPGVLELGLKEGAVGYSLDEYNRPLLPQPVIDRVEKIKQGVIEGKIEVPDYYKMVKK